MKWTDGLGSGAGTCGFPRFQISLASPPLPDSLSAADPDEEVVLPCLEGASAPLQTGEYDSLDLATDRDPLDESPPAAPHSDEEEGAVRVHDYPYAGTSPRWAFASDERVQIAEPNVAHCGLVLSGDAIADQLQPPAEPVKKRARLTFKQPDL